MTESGGDMVSMRVSDADRNGTMRRLNNALALGLIDIDEFEQRSRGVSFARTRDELDGLVSDLPGPGAIVTSATDRVELRGWAGSLKRHGEWTVPTRLSLVRRFGNIDLDLTKARFAGPVVVIEIDMKFGSLDLRLPEGASASIDDVEAYVGSASDRRKDPPAEGNPHVILTGQLVFGSVIIRGPRRALLRRPRL
ncbi:DUF1707 domain-containing protein [Mycobacterium asiaticum]|uniref:DUF1707 domain-containing protein n=1 Tax=Mycobacterium asiaticum TaxID=1790 RepID=A0A1A3NY44_MYCAS|nr:DUF1707 domain-containing protein [Mycobacterium asiaticum]OBK25262.1 hypothetical protein A5635_15820 [Mycobacterium asiaticum]OBK96260.1 hypothetical protein A5645_10300 [Mycobacterium asiaticum]